MEMKITKKGNVENKKTVNGKKMVKQRNRNRYEGVEKERKNNKI